MILNLSLELACDYSTSRLIAGTRVFMEVITIKTKTPHVGAINIEIVILLLIFRLINW